MANTSRQTFWQRWRNFLARPAHGLIREYDEREYLTSLQELELEDRIDRIRERLYESKHFVKEIQKSTKQLNKDNIKNINDYSPKNRRRSNTSNQTTLSQVGNFRSNLRPSFEDQGTTGTLAGFAITQADIQAWAEYRYTARENDSN